LEAMDGVFPVEDTLKIRIVVNPISGQGRRPQDDIVELERIFADYGIKSQVICLQMRQQATLLAREAVTEGFDMVVAVGGDGTINEVVCGLVNSEVPLGIVPAGSGNGLARAFGIPLKIRQACRTIIQGRTREVDVGKMNDRFFLGVAGIGYDALVSKLFENRWGKRRGLLPYFHTAFRAFLQYKAIPVRLQLGDRNLEVVPLLVTVANTAQFGGGAVIAPQAKPDDGLFDVCIIRDLSFLKALFHWPKLFTGRIDLMSQLSVYQTDSLEISSDLTVPVHVDGEYVGESTHLRVTLLPSALRIRVPGDTGTSKPELS